MSVLRTPFCRELGIDDPIWSVGFGWGTCPSWPPAASATAPGSIVHDLARDAEAALR